MSEKVSLPFMNAYGGIALVLEKIKAAQTPDRFTQDFLSTKFGLKSSSVRPIVPFLKRIGFIAADGTPTDQYKKFRNDNLSGPAAADALKRGYSDLFASNEYAHELSDSDLKQLVVQVTGAEPKSSTVTGIVGSFKALRAYADFDADSAADSSVEVPMIPEDRDLERESQAPYKAADIRLGYTINLNLPATSDASVYNAIFRSLRENLLR